MGHGEVRLEELCAHITDGKHGDCEGQADSGFYFLSCKDVADGKLLYEGARQITEADFLDTHRRTRLEPSDILITNSGTIGLMAVALPNELTRRTTFQKSVAILKPIRAKVEPRFLYYLLKTESDRLIAFAGGTAQKNLLLRDLRAFTVRVPPHSIQRRIASILSAYDDLIENNTRRIKILEDMAQMIYREWFVNFRFPGHLDLSKIDFDALRDKFEKGRKTIEVQKLRAMIAAKLAMMVKLNRTRMDFLEEFQKMIDEYNAGSANVERLFANLTAFAKKLNEEEKRGLAEQLTEEELVIFDLLTKPRIELTNQETADVKKVAKSLLEKLKREKLVLDWRKQQTTRAMVSTTIAEILDQLPRAYSKDLYDQKCETVYQHFYDTYQGRGKSVYAGA